MKAPPTAPACSVEELQKLCNTLALQHAEVQRERDDFARQLAAMPRSTADAEKALLSIRQARDTLLTRNHELLGLLTVAEDRHAELQNQHEDLTRAHDAAMAELLSLRQEVAEARNGAEAVSPGTSEADRGLVTAMAEMGRKVASLTEERDDALSRAAELETRLGQCEAANAKQLAAVAQERDAAVGAAAAADTRIAEVVAECDALRNLLEAEQTALQAQVSALSSRGVTQPVAAPGAPPKVGVRKDPDIDALHQCFASLHRGKDQVEFLDQFSRELNALSLRGQKAGLMATHRIASIAAEYATWLKRAPAKISAALPNLGNALEMIDRLSTINSAEAHPDPTGALVYSVDDDVDNCECIAMAFEKVAFKTRYAIRPEAALADFTDAPCDLVLLDVDMPGMSGIELQKHIREIPHHRTTPIIFVSGHLSAKERVAALGNDLNHFVAKPYSLNELCLKALTLIVKARLGNEG